MLACGESNTLLPFFQSIGVFSDIEPSCECLCEINAQWSPNRRTQLLGSPTAKQNGLLACWVGFLWWDVGREPLIPYGVYPARPRFSAGKKGQSENTVGLSREIKMEWLHLSPGPPVPGLGWGCAHPADPTACRKTPWGAATTPANLSLDSEPKAAANPIILPISAPNCSLPGDLQMEFVTWRS